MRLLAVIAMVVISSCAASAYPVTIYPANCYAAFQLTDWSVMRFGPYAVCLNGTVTFQWTGMHGVFQIPSIACPSNFTGSEADTYKYLASASNGGQYIWQVPNVTGHYWVTSQWQQDCTNGMIAEFYVVDPVNQAPFLASAAHRISSPWWILAALLSVLVWMGDKDTA